jgi:hypothetical protein
MATLERGPAGPNATGIKKRSFFRYFFLFAVAILICTTAVSQAQDERPPKRLRNPATVRGFIGGESQDHYVIRARKGKTMTVRLSWRKEGDNTAGFGVSPRSSQEGEQLAGQESNDGNTWTGRIPKTGDYIISVTAHPSARYTLRVTIK